jgi:hypothetical protein
MQSGSTQSGSIPRIRTSAGATGTIVKVKRLPLVISTADDIRALCAAPRGFRHLPSAGIVVDIDGVDDTDRQTFRYEIARFAKACGCGSGAGMLLGGTIIIVVVGILVVESLAGALEVSFLWLVLAPLLVFAGKKLGIVIAERRFRCKCEAMLQIVAD